MRAARGKRYGNRYAELRSQVQELDEEHKRRGAEIEGREAEIDAIDTELSRLQPEYGSETQKERTLRNTADKKTQERVAAEKRVVERRNRAWQAAGVTAVRGGTPLSARSSTRACPS